MAKFDEDMGFVFISESCEFCNSKGPQNLKKSNSDIFYVEFESNLQDFDVQNRNGRNYDRDNVWEQMNTPRIRSMIETGNFVGELGHPVPEKAGEKLSQERLADGLYKERAFYISKPKLNGNVLSATIRTACTTEGIGYAKDILCGTIPQFSLRAFATMTNKNGKPYVNVRHICTYDSVLYPSHAIAHMTSQPSTHVVEVSESTNVFEQTNNGIVIPMNEIIGDINDENIEMILESYNLTESDIVGFDKSKKHAIIRNDRNIIYGNLNRDTIKKVKDFYSSF